MAKAFFTYTYRNVCQIGQKKEKLEKIEELVKSLTTTLLAEVEKHDPQFRVKQLYPTGSYYEGTKIDNPDEFDFMVVLDPDVFSGPFKLASKCNSSPWYQSIDVGVPKETTLYGRTDESRNSVLRNSTGRLKAPMIPERSFWSILGPIAERPYNVKKYNMMVKTKGVKHHKLYLEHNMTNQQVPIVPVDDKQCQILVDTHALEIGVDLMLAFKHPDPGLILSDPGFPQEYGDLLSSYGSHLVAKSCHNTIKKRDGSQYCNVRCNCWFVSFAAIETEMMKRLDEGHKKCYKVMKALLVGNVNYPGKCMNLSSYVLKNAFLFHVFDRNGCNKMRYESCIPRILEYLKNGFEKVNMPCFFTRDINVWGRVVIAPLISEVFDWDEYPGDRTFHAKLWVEFWRRVVMVINQIFEKAYETKDLWVKVPEEMGYIRAIIVLMLEEYSKSKRGESFLLESAQERSVSNDDLDMYKSFRGLSPDVKKLFPKYITEWKKKVTCKDFDIDDLIKVDI